MPTTFVHAPTVAYATDRDPGNDPFAASSTKLLQQNKWTLCFRYPHPPVCARYKTRA